MTQINQYLTKAEPHINVKYNCYLFLKYYSGNKQAGKNQIYKHDVISEYGVNKSEN